MAATLIPNSSSAQIISMTFTCPLILPFNGKRLLLYHIAGSMVATGTLSISNISGTTNYFAGYQYQDQL
jgi:hypothetical protein